MTTRWERLAGDTGVFALKLAFASDPDAGRGIDPETGASWGSFQIWVRGRNLCAHREENERIDSVHWYLLPLLEWFARNWDPLLHEERLPAKNEGETAWESLQATRFPPPAIEDDEGKASTWESGWHGWWSRHALQAARDGGLFPDIVFRRLRDRIEVSWGAVRTAGMPDHYRFTESERGADCLPPQSVAEPLHDVLSQAREYLSSKIPDSKRIETLKRKLRGLKAAGKARDDARERRLAWLAGLGTTGRGVRAGWRRAVENLSDLEAPPRQAMLKTLETPLAITGSCHAALMFGSLAPDVTEADVLKLARATVGLHAPGGEAAAMGGMCRGSAHRGVRLPPMGPGIRIGRGGPRAFRRRLRAGERVDAERLIEALGVHIDELKLSDEKVRGVSIAGPQHRPGIFVNGRHASNGHEAGRRFTLAHELCHLLFDREQGRALAVASGPWAPRAIEQRANAFAAMLLMPASLVKRTLAKLAGAVDTKEVVNAMAERLGAGRRPVLNHLANLGFVDETDRRQLEGQLSTSSVRRKEPPSGSPQPGHSR